jgi:LVIVD repeat
MKTVYMKNKIVAPLIIWFFISCNGKPAELGQVDAYVPVYSSKTEAEKITQLTPQPIVNGGKIATLGNYVFQVEDNKGIHVIDYSNPSSPVKKAFVQIALCHELTLKGNYLYTNNMADLVVLDISNLTAIKLTSRISNAFPDLEIQYPPATGVYFECPDANRGLVTAWELKKVTNPKCRR